MSHIFTKNTLICLGLLVLAFVAVGCGGQPARDGDVPAAARTSTPSIYKQRIENEISAASDAVEKAPTSAEALVNRGCALRRGGKLPEALDDFNKAIKLRPNLAVAYAGRSECLLAHDNTEQARKDCDEAIRLDPKCAEGYLARAWVLLLANDRDAAYRDCNQAVLLSPLTARAYLLRGIIQETTKRDQAMADFNDALRLDKQLLPAYQHRGVLFAVRKEIDKAKRDWREAVSLEPQYGSAHITLGIAARQAGDDETAITELATGLACNNADAGLEKIGLEYLSHAYNSRACSFMRKAQVDQAERDLRESIRIDPQYDWSYANLAKICCDQKRYSDAIRNTDAALRIDKNFEPNQRKELHDMRAWAEGMMRGHENKQVQHAPPPEPTVTVRLPPTGDQAFSQPHAPKQITANTKGFVDSVADAVFTKENALLALEVGLGAWKEHRSRPPMVHVTGYWRADGTYVKEYSRSWPKK